MRDAKKELLLERKLQFQELQLGLFARSLKPADFPFDPKTPEDVRALQVEVMHRHLQRTLSSADSGMLNGAIRNLETILCPKPQPVVTVSVSQQQMQGSVDEAALKKKVDEMKYDDETVVVEAINRLGSAPGSQASGAPR
jgi:hypothetical protein